MPMIPSRCRLVLSFRKWPSMHINKQCKRRLYSVKSKTLNDTNNGCSHDQLLYFDYERASLLGNTCWHEIVGKKCASKFIPVTRNVLIEKIIEDENLITKENTEQFLKFTQALDSTLTVHYKNILKGLKSLYNPLSPDRDTIQMKFFTRDQLLNREKSVLGILNKLLEEGHFYKLPDNLMKKALDDQNIGEGVTVKISPTKYATLAFWVIGMDVTPVDDRPWYVIAGERARKKREKRKSLPDPLSHEEYRNFSTLMELFSNLWTKMYGKQIPRVERYKRVFVAVRKKKEFKLALKGFKDIPCENLEFLLPDGKVKMKMLDKVRLSLTGFILVTFIGATTVAHLTDLRLETNLILSFMIFLILMRNWNVYKNMRNRYLVNMSQTLYFKSVANNLAMLPLITDRAEEESFKAAILIYSFLLSKQRKWSHQRIRSKEDAFSKGFMYEEVKAEIETWVKDKLGVDIDFHTSSAMELLIKWKIITQGISDERTTYLPSPLDDVVEFLPFVKGISLESRGDAFGFAGREADAADIKLEEARSEKFEWR